MLLGIFFLVILTTSLYHPLENRMKNTNREVITTIENMELMPNYEPSQNFISIHDSDPFLKENKEFCFTGFRSDLSDHLSTFAAAEGEGWIINSEMILDRGNVTRVQNDIIIVSGGSFVLNNATLIIESNSSKTCGIYVKAGGSIIAANSSSIIADPINYHFIFQTEPGSVLELRDSGIRGIGTYVRDAGSSTYGLFLNTTGSIMSNISIDTAKYGIILGPGASKTEIINCSIKTIAPEGYSLVGGAGIYLRDGSSNNTICNNSIFAPRGGGIYVLNSKFNRLDGNIIDSSASFGLRVWGNSIDAFNNVITRSNTVNGMEVGYLFNVTNHKEENEEFSTLIIAGGSNISVKNTTVTGPGGIFVHYTENATISDCNLIGPFYDGLTVRHAKKAIIENNLIAERTQEGMSLYNTTNSKVQGNNVTNNFYGINIYGSQRDLEISDNLCNENGRGLRLSSVNGTITVHGNRLENNSGLNFSISGGEPSNFDHVIHSDNTVNGLPIRFIFNQTAIHIRDEQPGHMTLAYCENIKLTNINLFGGDELSLKYCTQTTLNGVVVQNSTSCGLYLYNSVDTIICQSAFVSNPSSGIYAYTSPRTDIIDCEIRENGNDDPGYWPQDGIFLSHSPSSRVGHCTIENNYEVGIHVDRYSNLTVITSNVISGPHRFGIDLDSSCFGTEILGNKITGVFQAGICCSGDETTIRSNIIVENQNRGIEVHGDDNIITDNLIAENGDRGIQISSNRNEVSFNNFTSNADFGVTVSYLVSQGIVIAGWNNTIALNFFRNNSGVIRDVWTDVILWRGQALDRCNTTNWDNGTHGNCWENYSGVDEDNNGIGDTTMPIPGPGNGVDRYPIMNYTDFPEWDFSPPSVSSPPDLEITQGEKKVIICWETYDAFPDSYSIQDNGDYVVQPTSWKETTILFPLTDLETGTHNITLSLYDKKGNNARDLVWVAVRSTHTPLPTTITSLRSQFPSPDASLTCILSFLALKLLINRKKSKE